MSVGLVPSLASFRSQVTNVWRDARAVSRALPINALPDVWPRPPTRTPQSPPTPTPTTTLCRVFSPATLSHEYACEHTFWVSMVTNFSMQSPLSVCLLSSQPADRSFFLFLSCVRRIYIYPLSSTFLSNAAFRRQESRAIRPSKINESVLSTPCCASHQMVQKMLREEAVHTLGHLLLLPRRCAPAGSQCGAC